MIFSACERFGILPPGCKERWEDMTETHQAMLLAYGQIKEYEEAEILKASMGRML